MLGSSRPDELDRVRAWRETQPGRDQPDRQPVPHPDGRARPGAARQVAADRPDPGGHADHLDQPGRLDGGGRADARLGGQRRGRRRRRALGRRRRRDAARRGRPRAGLARPHRQARRTRRRAQRPRLRPGALPRPRHRRHHRPGPRVASGSAARSENAGRRRVRAQHAHRGGLLLARLAPRRGHGADGRALLPVDDGRHRRGPRARAARRHDHRRQRRPAARRRCRSSSS